MKKATLSFAPLMAHLRTPLFKNAYALILSSVMTSGLGIGYWIMAAHFFRAEVVGLNSTLLSAMTLLSGIAQLILNSAVIRFLPTTGTASYRVAAYSYVVTLTVALVGATIFVFAVNIWSPKLAFLQQDWRLFALFVSMTAAWSMFSLQDNILTGLRKSVWIPIENMIFAIGKIGLLLLFTAVFVEYAIFFSWVAAALIMLLPVNYLIFTRFIPQHIAEVVSAQKEQRFHFRDFVRYALGDYFGSLFALAASTLVPLMVTAKLGFRANAYLYPSWMILTSIQLVIIGMMTSLTVEASRDQQSVNQYRRQMLRQSLRLIVPIIVIVLIGAPYLLLVFGDDYAAEGANLMRLIAMTAIPNLLVFLSLSIARVQKNIRMLVVIQGCLCVLLLGFSSVLIDVMGLVGVGVACLLSYSIVAVGLLVTQPETFQWRLPVEHDR